MRTGKLAISRGHRTGEVPAPTPRLVLVPRPPESPAAPTTARPAAGPTRISQEHHLAHERLGALERLARLHKQGMLSAGEFAAEKALVLSVARDELVLAPAARPPLCVPVPLAAKGPSLAGRLLSWKLLSIGLIAGLGFSFANQPEESQRFLDDALRLIGF